MKESPSTNHPKKKSHIKKRKVGIVLAILFSLILIGALGFSYWIGKQVAVGLFYQNTGNNTKQNSIDQLALWDFDLEAFEAAYTADHFTLTSEDQNSIPVTALRTDGSTDKNTAILVHGAGGDHVSTYPVAALYLENDWNVITFDQRSSGDSLSEIVTFGYDEQQDVKALVDYARNNTQDKKIVVHGISMGAATTGLYAATDHASEYLDYAILDSSYDSMESMFLAVWHQMDTEGIPDEYVLWCGNLYMNIHYGFDFDDVDIVAVQNNNYTPTLIIQGTQDQLCPPPMGKRLLAAIGSAKKEIWLVDSAHVEAYIDYPEEYINKVLEFVDDK